jgi:hypothetical protein
MIPDGVLVLNLTPGAVFNRDGANSCACSEEATADARAQYSAIFFCGDDINEAARSKPATDCLCDQSNMASLSVLVPFAS